jgi:hypothetical protein
MDANTTQQEQQMMQKEDGENAQEATISDAEAKKYLDALNAKSRTYLYRLNTPKPQKENTDEKPW